MTWMQIKHNLLFAFARVFLTIKPRRSATYQVFGGDNSSHQLGAYIGRQGFKKLLIVTDKPLVDLGIVQQVLAGLENTAVESFVFDGVLPDPTFSVCEQGLAVYHDNHCDSILAIGGGSSIDAAKLIAIGATNSGDLLSFAAKKFKEDPAPLFAIPTTSGTGSEATAGAVISNDGDHKKSIISDDRMLPKASALDPLLLTGLPAHITAATGMDALTHAIEAYISELNFGDCREKGAAAIKIIFEQLPAAYENGADKGVRDAMSNAAYMAGQAINQVNVGNVHAIAHQLGAIYGIPHGLANAMVLPHVLKLSLTAARTELTEIAQMVGCNTAEEFIAAVTTLSERVGIPATAEKLNTKDFDLIVERAVAEGFGYGSPHLMTAEECHGILNKLLPQ